MSRILVAEDDDAVRTVLVRGLTQAGFDVTPVCDGLEALAMLDEALAPFDLLLTDIVMPEMDGIALALKVSAERPDLPILLMTGYAAERQRAHNLEALIHDVVMKPFSLEEIIGHVRRALREPQHNG